MIAGMESGQLYVVRASCEQAHGAISRARQKGIHMYIWPLIQHIVLD